MKPRVLVIGWDAADWRVIEPLRARGAMPALERLVREGCAGNIATLEPCLSPVLWTSIATGKAPWRHGVRGFVEPTPDRRGLRPAGSGSRTCKALWNIASQAGQRVHCAGWFASHPAERLSGVCVSDRFAVAPAGSSPDNWPLAAGSVQPESFAATLAEFRWHPGENTAAELQPFLHDAARLDQSDPVQQRRLTFLSRTLAQCTGVHAAATWLMEHEPWDLMMVYYEAIDQVCHEFMPFHPPQLPEVNARDWHHWYPAVEGIYRFHDLMLARLMDLAGPETAVVLVSDHGFVSGAQRPGPVANDPRTQAQWHRPFGIVVLHGPGIAAGERIYGASLPDIAPTVLQLLGLPCGADMDGKVLASAFVEPVKMETIPSWETAGPPLASFMPPSVTDEAAEAALLQQFAALGYVDLPDGNPDVCAAERELRFNEAQANAAAGRLQRAADLLRALTAEAPGEPRYQMALAQTLLTMGEAAGARAALESLPPDWRSGAEAELLHCRLLLHAGQPEEALRFLKSAAARRTGHVPFHCQQGMILLRLRRPAEAEAVFRSALTLDEECAFAWHGLAAALVEQGRAEESIAAALHAVELQHCFPEAHFVLGRALVRQGDPRSAIRALETALTQNPAHAASHSVLVRLHYRLGNPAAAHFHREALRRLRSRSQP